MCLAIPGRIETIESHDPLQRSGRVNFGGIVKDVNLACVPEAGIGDWVVVHVGVALSRLDEEEAARVFEFLERMGELAALDETAP